MKTFKFDVERDELSYDEVSSLPHIGLSEMLLSNFADKRVSLRYEKGRFVGDVYLEGAHFWRVEAEYYQHISPNNTGSGDFFWKLYIRTLLISEIPKLSEADLVFSFLDRRVRDVDSSGNHPDSWELPLLTYVG
ncbi:MAG: hypothetical protein GY801_46960 [bacterium]|nr:hypothetical protein [bacterium]